MQSKDVEYDKSMTIRHGVVASENLQIDLEIGHPYIVIRYAVIFG